jgi:hypothetical protein
MGALMHRSKRGFPAKFGKIDAYSKVKECIDPNGRDKLESGQIEAIKNGCSRASTR